MLRGRPPMLDAMAHRQLANSHHERHNRSSKNAGDRA
jgi:hypothetical protein